MVLILISQYLPNGLLIAMRAGYRNIEVLENSDRGIIDGYGRGFLMVNPEYIPPMIGAGLLGVDRLRVYEFSNFSLAKSPLSVGTVAEGNLLISAFTGRASYYANTGTKSNPHRTPNFYKGNFEKILVNGISITEKSRVVDLIISEVPMHVRSSHSVHADDLSLLQGILYSLRRGYFELFRASNSTVRITSSEDYFARYMVNELYDRVMERNALIDIAREGKVFSVDSSLGMKISVLLLGSTISKAPSTYTLGGLASEDAGSFVMELLSESITASYGDIVYGSSEVYGSKTVFVHYTYTDDILTHYYMKATGLRAVSLNLLTMTMAAEYFARPNPFDASVIYALVPPEPIGTEPNIQESYVEYFATSDSDGVITVTYEAYDSDGNIITDDFSTLTLGNNFLHKEMN